MNPGAEGKEYLVARFTVERERVERFASAIGDPGPGVPVTFVTAAEFAAFPAIVADPDLGLDLARVVHAEQEYDLERPLRVGETLTVRSRIAQARARGGHGFVTIETTLVDDTGAPVATARATMLERSTP